MSEDIIIKRGEFGFDVWLGDKHTESLCFDEMLGVIAAVCLDPLVAEMHKRWFMTDKEHEARRVMIHDLTNTKFIDHDGTDEPTAD